LGIIIPTDFIFFKMVKTTNQIWCNSHVFLGGLLELENTAPHSIHWVKTVPFNSLLLNMAIEIVDLPIENGDVP